MRDFQHAPVAAPASAPFQFAPITEPFRRADQFTAEDFAQRYRAEQPALAFDPLRARRVAEMGPLEQTDEQRAARQLAETQAAFERFPKPAFGLQAPILARPVGEGRVAPTPGVVGTIRGQDLAPRRDRYLNLGRFTLDKQTRTVYLEERKQALGVSGPLRAVSLPFMPFQAFMIAALSGDPLKERHVLDLFEQGFRGDTAAWVTASAESNSRSLCGRRRRI